LLPLKSLQNRQDSHLHITSFEFLGILRRSPTRGHFAHKPASTVCSFLPSFIVQGEKLAITGNLTKLWILGASVPTFFVDEGQVWYARVNKNNVSLIDRMLSPP